MNLKQLLGTLAVFLFLFSFQSCSSDYSISDDEIALKNDAPASPTATNYCKYNVSSSTAPGISSGDIVCFKCAAPCNDIKNKAYKITVESSTGKDSIITTGYVSGSSSTLNKSCAKCSDSATNISD